MKTKTYSDIRPEKNFSIENIENGKCTVLFFDDIQEESQEINNAENNELTKKVMYSYDVYTLEIRYRENLLEEIEKDIDKWLKLAKDTDYKEVAAKVREERDKLLQETDAEMCLDRMGLEMPEGTSSFTSWINFLKTLATAITGKMAKYRQELRDITKQPGFPYDITWPTKQKEEE